MKRTHRQEREQFKKLFRQENIDRFDDRYRVLEAFLGTERHLTLGELLETLDRGGEQLDSGFVRETLRIMCHFGFARKRRFDDGVVRYEHRHIGQHHDHMICTRCGRIIEFEEPELEEQQARISGSHGFHILQHRLEIYGICADCLETRIPVMPLVSAKEGERVRISDFSGGAGVRLRLRTMGLRLGDDIEVITNINRGQLVIASEGKRYVLGRGFAEKILVEPVSTARIADANAAG